MTWERMETALTCAEVLDGHQFLMGKNRPSSGWRFAVGKLETRDGLRVFVTESGDTVFPADENWRWSRIEWPT